MEQLFNSDAEFYFSKTQPLIGKKHILEFFNFLFRQYPPLKFDILRIIIQGQQAAIPWTNHGKTRRDKPYKNEGVTIMKLKDNKICFISGFLKIPKNFRHSSF